MKIPVYRAEGGLSTDTPGRSIRARRSVQQAARTELAKAEPMKALLDSVNEYTETRYRIETKNNLDNALLDAEEALRSRREELAKSREYGKVLDGDDPIWTRETTELQRQLSEKVGRDRYAQQQFQSQFRQLETRNRFALRADIDRRVEIAAAQNRARRLKNGEDQLANGYDLGEVSMILQSVVNDTQKMAAIKAGDLSALTTQQYEMLKRGAFRALENNADKAASGVDFVDQIKAALRDGLPETEQADLFDPRGETRIPEGEAALKSTEAAYVYGLMKMLSPSDRAQLLKQVGGTQTFLEGPTLAEQNAQRIAQTSAQQQASQMGVRLDEMASGNTLSADTMTEIRQGIEAITPYLDADTSNALGAQYAELEYINNLQIGVGKVANLENIAGLKARYADGIAGKGGSGVDTKFEQTVIATLNKFEERMTAALAPSGDAIDFAQRTKMDGVKIAPVDLSVEGIMEDAAMSAREGGPTMLQYRIQQGQKIRDINGLDYTPVLTKAEAEQVVENILAVDPAGGVSYLKTLTGEIGNKDANILIENMRRSGLPAEYVQAMYVDDPKVMQDIASLVGRSKEDLKAGLPSEATSGATGVPQSLRNSSGLEAYRKAYLAGGDGAAAEAIFNEQYDIAERLAYSYVKDRGMTPAKAVETAYKAIFRGTPMVGNRERYIAPDNVNSTAVSNGANALLDADVLRRFDIISLDDPRYEYYENIGVNIESLAGTGIWLNNSTGDGLILHYDLNGTYVPVQLHSGGYLDVSFDTLSKLTPSGLRSFEGEGLNPDALKNVRYVPSKTDITSGVAPAGSEFPGLDPSLMQSGNQ